MNITKDKKTDALTSSDEVINEEPMFHGKAGKQRLIAILMGVGQTDEPGKSHHRQPFGVIAAQHRGAAACQGMFTMQPFAPKEGEETADENLTYQNCPMP